MVRRLELMGDPGPWRNAERFVESLRAYKPTLSDDEIVNIVRRENAKHRPRHPNMSLCLFGRDILTDDLPSIDAWPHVSATWKHELPTYPVFGGEMIPADAENAAVALANARSAGKRINRGSWVFPVGLGKTYVWDAANDFIQTVEDADVEVLRRSSFRLWFRDPDMANGPVQIQRYDYAPTETLRFRTIDDLSSFERDKAPVQQWKGV